MKALDIVMQVPRRVLLISNGQKIIIFIRLLMVFVVVRSVSRFIYHVSYQPVIYMLMKKVSIGAELDGQPECRILSLGRILVQDSVIYYIGTCARYNHYVLVL